ncbi:hypothetical protein M8C13_16675 [Crossiella sp. SN42]|uniref:hypothetical protein n=1 Tax=Crossiella sp. SN42 TaxID=2944808 RepID=UPI00207D5642|nr:hypothetical protein [Crossiella sp. SN42]MCO1577394.1 hypothetical protein [Crossiella sp. SN42]
MATFPATSEGQCNLCRGTGYFEWTQPEPGPGGSLVLRQLRHPCVHGCSGWWRQPAAERDRVVEGTLGAALPGGQVSR